MPFTNPFMRFACSLTNRGCLFAAGESYNHLDTSISCCDLGCLKVLSHLACCRCHCQSNDAPILIGLQLNPQSAASASSDNAVADTHCPRDIETVPVSLGTIQRAISKCPKKMSDELIIKHGKLLGISYRPVTGEITSLMDDAC